MAQSDGHGTVDYSDQFTVTSSTLPNGTPVDVALCVLVRIRHAVVFGCGGSVFEGVNTGASTSVSLVTNSASRSAQGSYSERWNCFDGHSVSSSGLLAATSAETTLTLSDVPVGTVVTVNASIQASGTITSFSASDVGRVEMALVLGYSSSAAVRLVSTATSKELSPIANCSADSAARWLPPPPGGTLAAEPPRPVPLELRAPYPNPAHGSVSLSFALPQVSGVDLAVFDVAGARVATVARGRFEAGEHTRAWDGRDASGRSVRSGLYWVRLRTPTGSVSRIVSIR